MTEPCVLNGEFQHFILRFNNKKFPYFADTTEREGVKGGPKDRGEEERMTLWLTLITCCEQELHCILNM